MTVTYTNTKAILTAGQVEQWRKERDNLTTEMESVRGRLIEINGLIEAAEKIMAASGDQAVKHGGDPAAAGKAREREITKPLNGVELPPMTDAIVNIVAEAGKITRKKLRSALADKGYDKKRLGNYFYTAVTRLKEQEKLQKRGDYILAPPETKEPDADASGS